MRGVVWLNLLSFDFRQYFSAGQALASWCRRAEESGIGAPARVFSDATPLRLAIGRDKMSLGTILLIILVLLLIGAIPTWPHSRGWGYGPSGGLGLVLVILLVLWLMGKI
jgi:hypothetical protein